MVQPAAVAPTKPYKPPQGRVGFMYLKRLRVLSVFRLGYANRPPCSCYAQLP